MLHTIYYMLHTIYYIVCTIYYILYNIYYLLYAICYVLYTIYYTITIQYYTILRPIPLLTLSLHCLTETFREIPYGHDNSTLLNSYHAWVKPSEALRPSPRAAFRPWLCSCVYLVHGMLHYSILRYNTLSYDLLD